LEHNFVPRVWPAAWQGEHLCNLPPHLPQRFPGKGPQRDLLMRCGILCLLGYPTLRISHNTRSRPMPADMYPPPLIAGTPYAHASRGLLRAVTCQILPLFSLFSPFRVPKHRGGGRVLRPVTCHKSVTKGVFAQEGGGRVTTSPE